jgi:formate-dependent nitrite reductase membrane component NrfD
VTADDGRYIDARTGVLAGEGAQQRVDEGAKSAAAEVWPEVPSPGPRGDPTYYDRPILKEPVWIWVVPAYFYVGGAAGAAAVLAEVSEWRGGELAGLARRARWIAAGGAALGSALLVYDLGRPERFLHMLRVFRPSSPMSVGSWVLAAATGASGAAALLRGPGGFSGRLGSAAGKVAALLGLPLSGYTAVLLSATAVPLWQAARHVLPVLFMASAASSAAALLELMELNAEEAEVVRRFGIVAELVELAASFALPRRLRPEQVARPLREGVSGALWNAATASSAAGLVLSLVPGRARWKSRASGLVGTVGGLTLRFAILEAGKASARDPRATFHQQRAGFGAAELRGAWRPPRTS